MKYDFEAVVIPELCVSCGICVGACPTATPFRTRSALVPGIDLPSLPAVDIRDRIRTTAALLRGNKRILSFSCRDSTSAKELRAAGEAVIEVECMGQIPPPFFDYILSRNHADGVFLTGCSNGACRFRFGAEWTAQRIHRQRDPRLRKRIDDTRIAIAWQDFQNYQGQALRQIQVFRDSLPETREEDQEAAA